MAWSATIVSVVADATPGIASVDISYTNGTRTEQKNYRISVPSSLRKIVVDQINEYDRIDAVAAFVASPPLGPYATSTPPTQAEIDRAQFLKDYTNWVNVKTKLVDTGVVPLSNTSVQALLTKVQSEFKAAYIPYL